MHIICRHFFVLYILCVVVVVVGSSHYHDDYNKNNIYSPSFMWWAHFVLNWIGCNLNWIGVTYGTVCLSERMGGCETRPDERRYPNGNVRAWIRQPVWPATDWHWCWIFVSRALVAFLFRNRDGHVGVCVNVSLLSVFSLALDIWVVSGVNAFSFGYLSV